MMKDQKTIQEIADYIIDNHTISEASSKFHFSERTVQNYIKELNIESSRFYNSNLYDKVRLSQKKMSLLKAKQGGEIGKRGPSTSEFDLEEIARVMIDERLSLSMASKFFSIPISTLYDGLKRLDDVWQDELEKLYEENKSLNQFNGIGYFR